MWKTIVLIGYLAILSLYDIRTRKVPAVWLVIGGVAALGNLLYLCLSHTSASIIFEIVKSMWPGLLMLILAKFGGKTGCGDGCVLLVVGGVLGSGKTAAVFLAALLLTALTAVILLVLRKVGRDYKLPFVPFLTLSALFLELV